MSKNKEGGSDNLEFSLTREEKPVKIGDKKYVLVEMDGKERDNYLTGLGARVKHGPDGKPQGLKSFDGLQASLVAFALREVVGGERMPVPIETIQSWPARIVTRLYETAKEMNALGEEEDDKKGNG